MVAPFTTDADAAVRTAALDALAGARGVGGVRGIVTALADGEVSVRTAAVAALREVARDAPKRYAHALFHASPDVRRARPRRRASDRRGEARDLPARRSEVADLVQTIPWPSDSLGIALELYARGDVGAAEVTEQLMRTPSSDLRNLLDAEYRRAPEIVDAYLDHAALYGAGQAVGHTSSTVSSARSARPGTSARSST